MDNACGIPPPENRFARVLEHCLAEVEAGRVLDREQLRTEHPDLFPRLQACLPVLSLLQEVTETLPIVPDRVLPGYRIGDFVVHREIGRGGMGVVYEAEQVSLSRPVALKVLPAHLTLRRATIERFRREAATAARLRHPGIVPILAVGEHEGTHYFAMELVAGAPLDRVLEHLREGAADSLTGQIFGAAVSSATSHAGNAAVGEPRAPWDRTYAETICRIGIQVADALECAHAAGVVHRDVKPGNILVRPDGSAVLTDFGLAREDGLEALTRSGVIAGTPRYVSPEQARGNGTVDHRSDVFALGVTLYELLTLEPPFPGDTAEQVLHAIRRAEPRRPQRHNQRLAPDLATILLKSLEKEPAQRYASAAALAADLRAFLEYRPIAARRTPFARRAWRWARREPLKASFAATLLVSLTVLVVLAGHARTESERASTVLGFVESMLASADPYEKGRDYKVRQMLDEFHLGLGRKLASQPAAEASVRRLMGRAYLGLGILDTAQLHLDEALAIRKRLFGERHELVAESLEDRARLQHEQGRYRAALQSLTQARAIAVDAGGAETAQVARIVCAEADELRLLGDLRRATESATQGLDLMRRVHGEAHVDVAGALATLGIVLREQGMLAAAEDLYRQAYAMNRTLLGNEHPEIATSLNNLAVVLKSQGRAAAAEGLFRDAHELYLRLFGDEHPKVAASLDNLGQALRHLGRLDEAEDLHRKAWAMNCKLFGDEHPQIATSLDYLAAALLDKGKPDDAEELRRKALAMNRNLFGPEDRRIATSLNELAFVLQQQGKFGEAEARYLEALAMNRNLFGEEHPKVATNLGNLASVLQRQGKAGEAEAMCHQALEMDRKLLGDENPAVATGLNNLASVLMDQGRLDEAEPLLRDAVARQRRLLGDEHSNVAVSVGNLAGLLLKQGKPEEAEALLDEALATNRKVFGDAHPGVALNLHDLARVLHVQGRLPEAEARFREALRINRTVFGDVHSRVAMTMNNLAAVLRQQGKLSAAEDMIRDVFAMSQRLYSGEHANVAMALNNLANVLWAQGKFAEAEERFRQAVAMRRTVLGPGNPETAASLDQLANMLRDQGKLAECEQYRRETLAALGDGPSVNVAKVQSSLAVEIEEQGRVAEAETFHQQAVDTMRLALPAGDPEIAGVLAALGRNLLAQERHGKAELVLRECLQIREAKMPGDWRTWNAKSLLGGAITGQGRHEEADPLLLDGYVKMEPPPGAAVRRREALERLIAHYEAWGRPEEAARWRQPGSGRKDQDK